MLDVQSLIKYLLEGVAVAVAAYLLPRRSVDPTEIAMIALTAAAVFAILDTFSPSVAQGARQGSGYGIGRTMVGGCGGPMVGGCAQQREEEEDVMNVPMGIDSSEHYATVPS